MLIVNFGILKRGLRLQQGLRRKLSLGSPGKHCYKQPLLATSGRLVGQLGSNAAEEDSGCYGDTSAALGKDLARWI